MKEGRTLIELAQELERQRAAKKDYISDTRNLRMDATGDGLQLSLRDDRSHVVHMLGVNDNAHRQIGTALGIPSKYYDKMQRELPDLLAANVNAWFDANPQARMIRTLDGNARAFLSDRYRRIDNFEIAQAVLPILADMPDAHIESCEVTENRMYLKCVNPRLTADVVPGDTVQAGIMITNSEIGLGSVTVQPLLYRLVCTNGMVVNDAAARKYHIGRANTIGENFQIFSDETIIADDKAFMLKIRDTVRAAVDEARFGVVVDMMRQAKGVKLETPDVPKFVELTATEFGMTQAEGRGVLDHLIRDEDLSLYGLANAVTRYSQDVESYDRATDLESTGYSILGMSRGLLDRLSKASAEA
ncbi:MAG: DUF932 domain-containing protein [Clostridia bacterium]|nr:DUF932 domain-containing protein [Clostridia bacterium]